MSEIDVKIELSSEEELLDVATDLVCMEQNYKFISRLLSLESGTWINVFNACVDLPIARNRLDKVLSSSGEKLYAMWMEFPELTDEEKEDDDFVVIFFYTDYVHTSTCATFNRGYFIERWAEMELKV